MIASCNIAVKYNSWNEVFTATLQMPLSADWGLLGSGENEPEGTGESFADALRDLAEQCDVVFV